MATASSHIPPSHIEPSLISIPAAWFLMGSASGQDCERPVHRVFLDAFFLASTQVTNREYALFLDSTAADAPIRV